MFVGKRFEEFAHGTALSALCLFEASPYAADAFEDLLVFYQFLIGFGALDHEFGLAVDGKDGGIS